MDLGIAGNVALVLGGTGRIGSVVARRLLEEGATVVLGARDESRLAGLAADLGGAVSTVVVDTRDAASVSDAVAQIVERHGSIDILVNAAAPPAGTLDRSRDREPEQMLDAIDGKAMGYLRAMNAVVPHMTAAGFGRIVNVSGQNALITESATATVRNGVVSAISKELADAVAGSGVTVNVVNPGPVRDDPQREPALGKPGESSYAEVGDLIVFLCSAPAGAISGEAIAVGHRVRGQMVL
jgi:NAD(P)-dependent dehydrogenase (short-subunit alcohol dehydrogenase family)